MECNKIKELLMRKTDEDIFPEEIEQLEEHLRSCENCQKEEEFWNKFKLFWREEREKKNMIFEMYLAQPDKETEERAKQILDNIILHQEQNQTEVETPIYRENKIAVDIKIPGNLHIQLSISVGVILLLILGYVFFSSSQEFFLKKNENEKKIALDTTIIRWSTKQEDIELEYSGKSSISGYEYHSGNNWTSHRNFFQEKKEIFTPKNLSGSYYWLLIKEGKLNEDMKGTKFFETFGIKERQKSNNDISLGSNNSQDNGFETGKNGIVHWDVYLKESAKAKLLTEIRVYDSTVILNTLINDGKTGEWRDFFAEDYHIQQNEKVKIDVSCFEKSYVACFLANASNVSQIYPKEGISQMNQGDSFTISDTELFSENRKTAYMFCFFGDEVWDREFCTQWFSDSEKMQKYLEKESGEYLILSKNEKRGVPKGLYIIVLKRG